MRWSGFMVLALLALPLFGEGIELDVPSFNFNISNHTLFTSTQNLESENLSPQQIRSETHLRAESGRYSLGVIASNRFAVARSDGADVPIVLEKKYVAFDTDHWQLVAGDSHHEIGRGIALALFRDETFGIDHTVEGGAIKYSTDKVEFKTFGGRVRTLTNPVALIPFQSPLFNREIWVGSASAKYKWKQTQIGAHYLVTQNRPSDIGAFDKRWHTTGLTFTADNFAPGWDAYGETNVMVNERMIAPFDQTLPTAYGTYASLVYSPLPWKLKLEVRDYRDYQYDFHRPPTMEEDIVTSLNFSNVTAARFWLERRVGVYNSLRASLLMGEDRVVKTSVRHAVAAVKWKFGPVSVEGRTGYRWLTNQSDLLHGDLKAKIPTFTGQFIEVGYRKLNAYNGLNFFTTLDDRNFFDLAYTFSAHWSLNFGTEYVPTNPEKVFFNVGTLVKLDSFSSRAFVGSTSGGPQCSGGICRMVPAYSGVMLEGTYAF